MDSLFGSREAVMSECEAAGAAAPGDAVRRPPAAPCGGFGGPVGRPPRRSRSRYPCMTSAGPQLESLPSLRELLPPDYSYHVCSYESLTRGFAAILRVNFSSERGARDWLTAFQQSSLTTFRIRRTFPRPGPGVLYKAWFRCQRNVTSSSAAASRDSRHTACPAALSVSVCCPLITRGADPHLPASPGCVQIKHVHNHPVRCAADLRYRGVSAATRGALETLLARGYAPAAARRALQHQLQLQLGERYPLAAADRAVLPTLKDVCRIYYQQYGTPAQRRAAAAAQQSVISGRETGKDGETDGDGEIDRNADDPEMGSENRRCLRRSDSGVAGLGLEDENTAAPRFELEIVDADDLMADSVNADDRSVPERVNSESQMDSDTPVLESTGQTGVQLEPVGSNRLIFQSTEREGLSADQSEAAEMVVERPEPAEMGSADDATLELELVHSEDRSHQEQILESTDHTYPASETAAPQVVAVAPTSEPLPSLESLLAGRTVPNPDAIAARLEHLVTEYCTAMTDWGGSAAFRRLPGCRFAAALTTPLMRRVHLQLPQSGEMVFVDCPGQSDRHGCCLWLLVCASEAGALPLGLLLASSDSGSSLRAALELWRRTVPAGAFAGRGADGPQVVITDDGAGQRAAVAAQFPAALTVLCAFRLLQSVWRWLWQVRGRVPSADRSRLLLLARRLLCAGSVTQLERRFREAEVDPAMERHPDFLKQFTSIYRHRHLWAVWYGEESSDTNLGGGSGAARTASLFDLASSLLRDRLLFMAAEYGPAEAFDFWTRRGDPYFVQRINRALSGEELLASHPRYVPLPPGAEFHARRSGPHEYEVTESDAAFQVDLELGCCTCRSGRTGAPCVHQSAAARLERRPPPAPLTAEVAERLRRIVTRLPLSDPGPAPLPAGWLQAVTAAAGLPRLELIVSTEQAPESDSRLPSAGQREEQDAGVITGGSHMLQPEGGDTLECLQEAVDVNNSAGCSTDGKADHSVDGVGVGLGVDVSFGAKGAGPSADGADGVGGADMVGSADVAGGVDAASGADIPVDPAEEAMSAAIVALQEVTADLTGRLAAEPERYVPLVRDLVSRYWRLQGADGLRAMGDRLIEIQTERGAEHTETAAGDTEAL